MAAMARTMKGPPADTDDSPPSMSEHSAGMTFWGDLCANSELQSSLAPLPALGPVAEPPIPAAAEAKPAGGGRQRRRIGSQDRRGSRSTSRFRGVTHHCRTGRWEAHIWEGGKQVYLGGFSAECAAALAYDLAAVKCRGVEAITNFALENYQAELASLESITKHDLILSLRTQSRGAKKAEKAAAKAAGEGGSRGPAADAVLSMVGQRYQVVGVFDTAVEAAAAYDRHEISVHGVAAITNYDIGDYEEELEAAASMCPADAWGSITVDEVRAASSFAVKALEGMHPDAKRAVVAELAASSSVPQHAQQAPSAKRFKA